MFVWDHANINHIADHGVTPEEAEQVVRNHPIEVAEERRNGELRTNLLGRTDDKRILVVVVTPHGSDLRVVTAHPAKHRMRRFYETLRRE